MAAAQWERARAAPGRWGEEWCLLAAAALGRAQLVLASYADDVCAQVQVCVCL